MKNTCLEVRKGEFCGRLFDCPENTCSHKDSGTSGNEWYESVRICTNLYHTETIDTETLPDRDGASS